MGRAFSPRHRVQGGNGHQNVARPSCSCSFPTSVPAPLNAHLPLLRDQRLHAPLCFHSTWLITLLNNHSTWLTCLSPPGLMTPHPPPVPPGNFYIQSSTRPLSVDVESSSQTWPPLLLFLLCGTRQEARGTQQVSAAVLSV